MTKGKQRDNNADRWLGLGVVCLQDLKLNVEKKGFAQKTLDILKGDRGRVVGLNKQYQRPNTYEVLLDGGTSCHIGVDVIAKFFEVNP